MTSKLIAGADFSGAKETPNNTWLAIGSLGNLGLEILDIVKIGSHKLAQELTAEAGFVAAGLDFPFSLPLEFLSSMAERAKKPALQSWQEVAEQLIFMPFEEFLALVVEFKKEPKRICDKSTRAPALSPLHRGNPSMVQMTYQGIRMLAALDPGRFAVMPFNDVAEGGCAVIEVYPRETLVALGLPDTGYKSKEKKDEEKVALRRREIVRSLVGLREQKGASHKDCPRLTLSAKLEHLAVSSDHALDALIACYTAAFWVTAPKYFADPFSSDQVEVLLEGWIYAPALA